MNAFMTRIFEFSPNNYSEIPAELLNEAKDELRKVPDGYEAWVLEWSVWLQQYIQKCPEVEDTNPACYLWMMGAFSALLDTQPRFEYRDSVWIPHLCYPDLDAIWKDLEQL